MTIMSSIQSLSLRHLQTSDCQATCCIRQAPQLARYGSIWLDHTRIFHTCEKWCGDIGGCNFTHYHHQDHHHYSYGTGAFMSYVANANRKSDSETWLACSKIWPQNRRCDQWAEVMHSRISSVCKEGLLYNTYREFTLNTISSVHSKALASLLHPY